MLCDFQILKKTYMRKLPKLDFIYINFEKTL